MPFDNTNFTELKPSLALLSEILRDPGRWPEGFGWDYGECEQCAMGLAFQLWPGHVSDPFTESVADAFDMPRVKAADIFIFAESEKFPQSETIKPHHVADAIDEYLANG